MELGQATYTGHHRANEMPLGIGMFPMGDRSRDTTEYGVNYIEERDSIAFYDRFLNQDKDYNSRPR